MTDEENEERGWDSFPEVLQALNAPKTNPALPIHLALKALRQQVLLSGLPSTSASEREALRTRSCTTMRGKLWKVLLGAPDIQCQEYLDLVKQGPSRSHSKIEDDVFRTFASDEDFRTLVRQEQLTRVLNVTCTRTNSLTGEGVVYVQGMNAICGVLLLELNELDAVAVLLALVERHCPFYLNKTIDAVHVACGLIDETVAAADPELAQHLCAHALSARIYAFPWVLSLGTCFPPLSQAVALLDFLFTQGVHGIVACAAARVCSMRTPLLASQRPMQVLQQLPPMKAADVVAQAGEITERLEWGLLERIRTHPYTHTMAAVSGGEREKKEKSRERKRLERTV